MKISTRIYLRLLPTQMMLAVIGTINSIIDGAIAGRYLSAEVLGATGMYFSIVCMLNAIGNILLGGTSICCGNYLGRSNIERANGVFSLNITATILVGILASVLSLLFVPWLARFFGLSVFEEEALLLYAQGYVYGIVPMLLVRQLTLFMQLGQQKHRELLGILGMILANLIFDVLFIIVFELGAWGLAFATSLANFVYLLILLPGFFSRKAQFHFSLRSVHLRELFDILKIGFPGGIAVFCNAFATICVNGIMVEQLGHYALCVVSAFYMVSEFFLAYSIGNSSVVRMISSIYIGEENRGELRNLARFVLTRVFPGSFLVGLLIIVLAEPLSAIFFVDRSSASFLMCRQFFIAYGFCVPFTLLCSTFKRYLHAKGQGLFVTLFSVYEGFLGIVLITAILTPALGPLGICLAYPLSFFSSVLILILYVMFRNRRIPRNADEWMLLDSSFGVRPGDQLCLELKTSDDVVQASERAHAFCRKHGISARKSYHLALCLEEMAYNIIKHGFQADGKENNLNITVIYKDEKLLLRIKDDCRPFNPKERAGMVTNENMLSNIGIRLVSQFAEEMSYQNMMGLNVLTIRI
ncbi:MAG: MATE family efflux transporter [Bacillota bacterium]|nr:MATE family efflux transporter [Bacillota bacterium]